MVGCVVAAALAVWSTRGAWGGRPPAGEDVMAHLVRLDFGIADLVAHGRLDGWFPRFYLGYQEFLFNGPGLAWAVAALRGVTFGLLSNTGGVKLIGVLSFAALPVAMAFLARSLGLGRLAAGIAAVLSLLVSNPLGVGLQGLYLWGLLSHQLGAVFFCLALGALLRVPVDGRWRWLLLGAVSLAALAITHLATLFVLAVFFPFLAVGVRRQLIGREALLRLGLTGALALAMAAWWVIPALVHRDLRGPTPTWPTPPFGDRVEAIFDGQILFRPYTMWLIVAGWLYALTRVRRWAFALPLVVAPIAYVALTHWATPRVDNDVVLQLANRGLGYAGLLAVLPLAAALAAAVRFADRRPADRAPAVPVLRMGALVLAAIIVLSPLGPRRSTAQQLEAPTPQLQHAAAELARSVPDGARFVTRRDLEELTTANEIQPDRLGHIPPAFWLAHASGRNSLNGFNFEASNTPAPNIEADQFVLGRPADADADTLSRLGVSHVVTMTDALGDQLAGSERFELGWRESPIAIFAVRPRPGEPEPASLVATGVPATARLRRADPERLRIDIDSSRATQADVAIAWSPKWHATIDGRATPIAHTADGLITVRVPAGRSTLTLAYEPDAWDRIGVAISALTLAALAVLGVRSWRRRRQAPRSAMR